ncbi:MAG: CorA family divalent cation transporter, partial [Parasphingopyxis sp.]
MGVSETGSFTLGAGASAVREIARDEAAPPGTQFLWEHIELGEGDDVRFDRRDDIPEIVLSALTASETRPRCDQIGDGALINLRGPALAEAPGDDRLVSIRAWARGNRVTSVSRRRLAATNTAAAAMQAGQVTDPGDLVAAFARSISSELDPVIAGLGDAVDDCETEVEEGNIYPLRRRIAQSRSDAIAYRRFIAPNRDALVTLAGLKLEWLSDEDRLHIREAADRFARMVEELEAIRERAALLHEQLTDLRAELIDQRSLLIAIVAFIFLPLTFITGLLGMNVEGIPFAREAWAFWGVVVF